jgi:acetylornithine/succinyldiaminopimelate/putrescine aminotransferase
MIVLGKGLGGGSMPLAALIAREGLNVARTSPWGTTPTKKTRSPAPPGWQCWT